MTNKIVFKVRKVNQNIITNFTFVIYGLETIIQKSVKSQIAQY